MSRCHFVRNAHNVQRCWRERGRDEAKPLIRVPRDRLLLGFVPELATHYQAVDVYVISGVREVLPSTMLGAVALETPLLATRIGGILVLISHNVSGMLVPPGWVANSSTSCAPAR